MIVDDVARTVAAQATGRAGLPGIDTTASEVFPRPEQSVAS